MKARGGTLGRVSAFPLAYDWPYVSGFKLLSLFLMHWNTKPRDHSRLMLAWNEHLHTVARAMFTSTKAAWGLQLVCRGSSTRDWEALFTTGEHILTGLNYRGLQVWDVTEGAA